MNPNVWFLDQICAPSKGAVLTCPLGHLLGFEDAILGPHGMFPKGASFTWCATGFFLEMCETVVPLNKGLAGSWRMDVTAVSDQKSPECVA